MEVPAARVAGSIWRARLVCSVSLVLLLGVIDFAPAGATTVVAKGLEQLCAEADRIFVGTVSDLRSAWADARQGSIETTVIFSDIVPLLGAGAEAVTLRFPGGEVDGVRESVSGMPQFAVGDRVVLFARAGATLSPLVGFHQGYFRVVESDAGAFVVDAAGLDPLLPRGGSAAAAPMGDDTHPGVPLSTFLEAVRDEIAHRGGRP